jgi:hypothetical protein
MYLRFVVADIHAIGKLRDDGKLQTHEREHHDSICKWFDTNLKEPSRFTASKGPSYRKQQKAISWFKDTAHEHLARIRSLVAILENHGIPVEMLKTERVGYVVYEDEFQIVAEAFAGERY